MHFPFVGFFYKCHCFDIWNTLTVINIINPAMEIPIPFFTELKHFPLFFRSSIRMKLIGPKFKRDFT